MTIDDVISGLRKSIGVKHDIAIHMDTKNAEQLLYWLTEYRAITSGRQSGNLSERLASHLVWAESNSYECPVMLAEDLQEAIATICEVGKTDRIYNENRCVCCGAVIPEGHQICIPCERFGGEK